MGIQVDVSNKFGRSAVCCAQAKTGTQALTEMVENVWKATDSRE